MGDGPQVYCVCTAPSCRRKKKTLQTSDSSAPVSGQVLTAKILGGARELLHDGHRKSLFPLHRRPNSPLEGLVTEIQGTMRQSKGLILERLRLDIEDLNLSEVKAIQDSYVVAISKHLCGPATDLLLRCCLNNGDSLVLANTSATAPLNDATQPKPIVDGLAIATCCHHLCQWKSYVNKRYFKNLDKLGTETSLKHV